MDDMATTLEGIDSLPDEYKRKISKYCIAGSRENLDKALNAALDCSRSFDSKDKMSVSQKKLSEALLVIRRGLAAELLRLEGFDMNAAKNRGKAETEESQEKARKPWSKSLETAAEKP